MICTIFLFVKNQFCTLRQILASGLWPYLVRVFSRIRPPDLRPDKDSRGCEVEAISTVKEAAETTTLANSKRSLFFFKETKVCLWSSPRNHWRPLTRWPSTNTASQWGVGATPLTCCVGWRSSGQGHHWFLGGVPHVLIYCIKRIHERNISVFSNTNRVLLWF